MPGNNHLLVFSHTPQLKWWSPVAQEVAQHLGVEAVAWVQGEHDRQLAESIGGYARVVDLLADFDPGRYEAELPKNLDRVRRYEEQVGVHCFHEDVAIDRHVSHTDWGLAQIIHYATQIMGGIDRQLERHGYPVAAMGEANTLPYRVAYRLLRPRLYYFFPALERSWPHRFYVDQSIDAHRPDSQQKYRQFMEQGMPEELEQIATERLTEFREKALIPFYSRPAYGAGITKGGTDPLSRKLQPRRAAGVVTRWMDQLLGGGDTKDPRSAHVRSPGEKLVSTAVEYSRKRAFEETAQPPATDGMEYCTYFLHVEPEYSVEGLAFDFRSQLTVIQNIAAMLPGQMRLYVKEHRPMLGIRSRGFFEALAAVPNILLLTDDVTAHDMIQGSRIVFTLTGTTALEAMFYGVPAVVLGEIYFSGFQGIYSARSPQELRAVIREVLAKDDAGATDEAAAAALAAVYASSFSGKIGAAYSVDEILESDNLRRVSEGILAALQARGLGS